MFIKKVFIQSKLNTLVQYQEAWIYITINGDSSRKENYVFSASGVWCYQGGGTSTKVINLYLDSGINTILFDSSCRTPLIDYIEIPL